MNVRQTAEQTEICCGLERCGFVLPESGCNFLLTSYYTPKSSIKEKHYFRHSQFVFVYTVSCCVKLKMKAFAVYLSMSLFAVGISQTIKDNGSLKNLPKFQTNCAFPQSTSALCTHWPNAKSLNKEVKQIFCVCVFTI